MKILTYSFGMNPQPEEPLRLSKYLSQKGICSRREADAWISAGYVYVDGQQITQLGTKILPSQKVTISREAQEEQEDKVTLLLNKPIGYVSAQAEDGYTPAIRLITRENQDSRDIRRLKPNHLDGLAVTGRLDIDSQGLLVFTQDGRIAKQLIGENSGVEKEYLVRVAGTLTEKNLKLLNHGLSLDDKPLKPAKVEWINKDQLRFVLKEGKKRQIRRMLEMVGMQVLGLKRVRTGRVVLGDLKEGQWRFMRKDEQF